MNNNSHYNAPTKQMEVHPNNHRNRNRAPLKPKQTFSPLVAKKMQEARQSSAALASKYSNGLVTPTNSYGNNSPNQRPSLLNPDGSPRTKTRRFNMGMIRKVNKFNVLVGEMKNKATEESMKKTKAAIHVTLDDSTLSIFKRLDINHERPAGTKPSASRKQIGQPKHVLTSQEHAKIASNLAFKYTRDAYKLQSFAALQADRVRLEQLKKKEEEEDMHRMRTMLIASHHQEHHEDTIAESDSEDDDSDDSPKNLRRFTRSPTNPGGRKREASSILTLQSPLQRSRSIRRSRPSGSFRSVSPSSILDSDDDSDDSELGVYRNHQSPENASRRRTTVVQNGRVQIKSVTSDSSSPKRSSRGLGSMSPKAHLRQSISQATSPVPPPRSLSISPTPSSSNRLLSSPKLNSPKPPLHRGGSHQSVLQKGGSNRSLSSVKFATGGERGSSPNRSLSPGPPTRSISFERGESSPTRETIHRGTRNKSMSRAAAAVINKLSPTLPNRSVSFKRGDNNNNNTEDPNSPRSLRNTNLRMYVTRKSVLDDYDSSSEDSFDKEMREDDEKKGVFTPVRQSRKTFRHHDSDSDDDSDEFGLSSLDGSQGSDSSGNSLMLDLDIAQARIVHKQEVAEAAKEEKERTERNKRRKRKADPIECGKERAVALPHAQLSDGWVETFAENITPLVRNIDFSHNPISKLASTALFASLTLHLKNLKLVGVDLSHSADALAKWLGDSDSCTVMRVNLSETKLSNKSIKTLCEAIAHTGTVTALDLSSNNISTVGCKSIAKMIANLHIQHLSLAWNKIEGSALAPLCKALQKKSTILSLDLSWNSIGTFPTPNPTSVEGMNALCQFISHTDTLFHFNLSANKFSEVDVKKLSEVLDANHTICGFHFDKNPHGHVDPKGYLHVISDHNEEGKLTHPSQLSGHVHEGYSGSTCWCCGQWVEAEFEFTQPYVNEDDLEDVYLRLSCDGFRKDKMDYVGNRRWSKFRMVPRITLTYNFCIQKGDFESNVYSPDQAKCFDSTAPTSTVNYVSLEDLQIACADVPFEKHYDAALCGGTSDNVIWPFFGTVLPMNLTHHHSDPRSGGWEAVEKKDNWCLDSSKLFGLRKKQNPCNSYWDIDALVTKAFANDWNLLKAKFGRMKISEPQIKDIGLLISKHYRRFINLYKRNVVLARSATFSLSMIGFEQFLTSCDILAGLVKKRDIDRIFISTMAEKTHSQLDTGSPKNPRRSIHAVNGLDRWEFFEALVRVAQLKYGYGNMEETFAAFKRLFLEHLRYALYVDPDDFRKEHLYTSECEGVLAIHNHNLHTIFNHYCSISSSAFGRLMKIEEFHQMVEESKLVDNGKISHDQASVCFMESKFTNADELKNNRHTMLTFMDFLEVICRMAFVVDHNKGSPHLSDFGEIAQEVQKRHQRRGWLIDSFQKSLVVGLREANTQFKRTLKIVFNDEDEIMKRCALVLQKAVRSWKARRRALRLSMAKEMHIDVSDLGIL
ncbi:hypothetical protein TrLO_g14199 [Triparma laevis f. longispina]|uniref:Uncharacterized protein n=1 Tax=Triparma laevis f. longispina TaxID=1714387 RepID=A0A9W7C462_9STRA|nr:hypothetical protein TrLO_g14199 [Triparma laevis f. longispina]